MKRHGNLWGQIISVENIAAAHKAARRGKTFYSEVKMVDENPEFFYLQIQNMLTNKQFTTSAYEVEQRFDRRKMRTIHKLPYYPDRIIHHALLAVIGPILTRTLIRDTFQSITGRGTSDAADRVKALVRSERCPKYALKLDIQKYYPSVNNDLLKQMLRKKIKCPDTLWLIDDIIDSIKGLPIGNYTSQLFGNINLNGFDWWMKQTIKPDGYFRYCDDLLVFADSSKKLMMIKALIQIYLQPLNLTIKNNWLISNVRKDGVDFVGYLFRPESTRLRKNISTNIKRLCQSMRFTCTGSLKELSSLMAYKGWVKRASAKLLWRKYTLKLRKFFPQLRAAI